MVIFGAKRFHIAEVLIQPSFICKEDGGIFFQSNLVSEVASCPRSMRLASA